MTYCVAMQLERGLIFMSDTRTNAGVDDVARAKKMFSWDVPGERCITLMTAGNLATTQAVVSLLDERTKAPKDRNPGILGAPSMFQVATMVGDTLREVVRNRSDSGPEAASPFSGTIILGAQIAGSEPRLFRIYPEGNFIEAGPDTPFFQIGETKYGRPILVRAYDPAMTFADAVRLMLVSFDSTIRANVAVAPPIDMMIHERDRLALGPSRRFDADDPYFASISAGWSQALKQAVEGLPPFHF